MELKEHNWTLRLYFCSISRTFSATSVCGSSPSEGGFNEGVVNRGEGAKWKKDGEKASKGH